MPQFIFFKTQANPYPILVENVFSDVTKDETYKGFQY